MSAPPVPPASLELPKPAYGRIVVDGGVERVVWCKRFRCDGCNAERSRPGTCCKCKIRHRKEAPPRICPDCGQVNQQVRADLCKLCKALRRPGSKESRAKANREARELRLAQEAAQAAEAAKAAEAARVAEEAARAKRAGDGARAGRPAEPPLLPDPAHFPNWMGGRGRPVFKCYSWVVSTQHKIPERRCENMVIGIGDYCTRCTARGWPVSDAPYHELDPTYPHRQK